MSQTRRDFLRRGFQGAGLLAFGGALMRCSSETENGGPGAGGAGGGPGSGGAGGAGGGAGGQGGQGGGAPCVSNIANVGPLGAADANGVRLPAGFTSRIVAVTGMAPVAGGSYLWHSAPDGGAVFPLENGGWVYVSNSEVGGANGGVGALVFSADAEVVDAYRILDGTRANCAGGATPWSTWLSCEEVGDGVVYECDPFAAGQGTPRPAMGVFKHEAVAVDPVNEQLYLTEDESDGRLYRFTPTAYPDLTAGTLEAMRVLSGSEGATEWIVVPDPSAASEDTRDQVPTSTALNGGEGIWFHEGVIYFATKGDDRIWAYETSSGMLTIIYDQQTSAMPILSGVDNVCVSPGGDVLVAEDGGDLEIGVITPDGAVVSLMKLEGHDASEITGPAFDPSMQRLYFSSQRGTNGITGITFEITGPFCA